MMYGENVEKEGIHGTISYLLLNNGMDRGIRHNRFSNVLACFSSHYQHFIKADLHEHVQSSE